MGMATWKQIVYFMNKALTLYDKDKNHYASIEVAGDLDVALDQAYKDYGLKVGLAELGSAHLCIVPGGLVNALYVGLHKVEGFPVIIWPLTGTTSIIRFGSKPGISR